MGFTEINGNLGVYVMPVDSFKWKYYEGKIILLNVRSHFPQYNFWILYF